MSSDFLSRHVDNDDRRHFEFVRDSKLPRGSFDEPSLGDHVVSIVMWCVAAFIVAGLAFNWFK